MSSTIAASFGSMLIRTATEEYCKLAGTNDMDSFRACVRALCDIRNHTRDQAFFQQLSSCTVGVSALRQCVLVACVCLNNVAVVKQILSTIPKQPGPDFPSPHTCYFTSDTPIFECPAYVAARLGRHEILQLFLELNFQPYSRCTMAGIAHGGSIDTLNFLITFKGPSEASLERPMRMRMSVMWLRQSSDPMVWERGLWLHQWVSGVHYPEFREWVTDPRKSGEILEMHVRNGSVRLLRHLFDLGMPVHPVMRAYNPNLSLRFCIMPSAAWYHQLEVVKLLLDKGADLNHETHQFALSAAAAAGSLDIIRVLVEHGANIHDKRSMLCSAKHYPIVWAVLNEHMAMFNFLKERGALTKQAWDEAMTAASEAGLDSMVDMLNEVKNEVDDGVQTIF
jgi:hypothetical protein